MNLKRVFAALPLAACLALAAATAQEPAQKSDGHKHEHGKHEQGKQPHADAANVTVAEGQVVKRGAPLGKSPVVKLADVLKEPKQYAGKTLIVEGVVERVCQKQGCWMEIAPEKGARGVRVQTKDHAFFVPFNAAGLKARAEGTVGVKYLTEEEATHLEKEGASLKRDKDGEASEVSFVATGVELRK